MNLYKIQTTLIIPTLDRPNDLARCLHSITRLIEGFDEIIIVEQGDLKKTEAIIQQFNHLNIKLYFHSVASAAQARNKAIEKAQGEFIFFVDDDTELPPNYVKIALNYFKKDAVLLGLTGKIDTDIKYLDKQLVRLYHCLFLLNGPNMNINKAGNNNNSWLRGKTRYSQWLFGGHMVCRRTVFDEGFRFNNNLICRSDYEDVMFSYKVYKHYGPDTLIYSGDFTLKHFKKDDKNRSNLSLKMNRIYHFIFWYEEIYKGSPINLLCYVHNQIGFCLTELFHPVRGGDIIKKLKTFAEIYIYIFKNYKAIIANSIDYNQFILSNK